MRRWGFLCLCPPVTGSGLALGSGKAKGGHSGVHAAVSCQQSAPPHWKNTALAAPHSAPTPPSQGPVQPQLLPLCSGRIHLPQSLREDSLPLSKEGAALFGILAALPFQNTLSATLGQQSNLRSPPKVGRSLVGGSPAQAWYRGSPCLIGKHSRLILSIFRGSERMRQPPRVPQLVPGESELTACPRPSAR